MGRTTVYHNGLVTAEKWERVNPDNKTLLSDFVGYLQSANKSSQTIQQYTAQLKIVFVFVMEQCENKFFVDLKKRDLIKFAGWLQNTLQVSPNRIATMKSVISSLSAYIERVLDEEYPTFRNISNVIEVGAKEAVREKTILSEDDINAGLEKLVVKGRFQAACFMALLFASGMRKAEAIQMRVDDFIGGKTVMNGIFYLTHKIRTKGRGKAGKVLAKYVSKELFDRYLTLWIEERQKQGIESEWLFVTKKAGQWVCATVSTADSFADTISSVLDVRAYCHSFRHAWCTYCHRKGYPETIIQKLQGWAGLDMVSLYNDIGDEEQLEDFFSTNNTDLKGE